MPIHIVNIDQVPLDEVLEVIQSIDQLAAMLHEWAHKCADGDPVATSKLRAFLHHLLDSQPDEAMPIVMEGFLHHHLQIRSQYKQRLEQLNG